MMNKNKWLKLAVAMGLAIVAVIAVLPKEGLALPTAAVEEAGAFALVQAQQTAASSTAAVPPADSRGVQGGSGVRSLSGSSVATSDCYTNTSQTFCFNIYNGSTSSEWITRTRLTFPQNGTWGDWSVSCHWQDPSDSSGSPVNMNCDDSAGHEVLYIDNDTETPTPYGEITANSSWFVCVNATIPAGYIGPRIINWGLYGDGDGDEPHYVTGTIAMPHCDPLMLRPESISIEGCSGITQEVAFELENVAAGNGTSVSLDYVVSTGNGVFTGPSAFTMSEGEVITFVTQIRPDRCVPIGGNVNATLTANGGGESDFSTLQSTAAAFNGWQAQAGSGSPTMDSVVVWASEGDGGLWSIGGYGSERIAQRYDPVDNSWITYTADASPTIEYPMDGCYGLNGAGDEIVVLFPDTILTDTLRIFNITDKAWEAASIPTGYPAEGRWGHDVVSLLNTPGVNSNVCYMSGGSTREGGGRVRDLWVYYPNTNSVTYLDSFPAPFWFGFHASWYVPWVGTQGAICVAGGIDHNSQISTVSQCYDLSGGGSFNTPNADLGPLPEPWWGMADGWQLTRGRYQIWMANGVAQDGSLLPASLYADETTNGFVYGPAMPISLYRLEGDGYVDRFYTLNGAAGGFNYTVHNQLLAHCPWCATVNLPLALRGY